MNIVINIFARTCSAKLDIEKGSFTFHSFTCSNEQ